MKGIGLKVVSFDFDNTLEYIDPPAYITTATILERHGVSVDREEMKRIWVRERPEVSDHPLLKRKSWGLLTDTEKSQVLIDENRRLLTNLGIQSNLEFLTKAINKEWFAVRRLYPDVPETFQQLGEMGVHIAILSGVSSTTVKAVLKSQDLVNHIACFATADIASSMFGPLRKDDGSPYRYLLEEMKARARGQTILLHENIQIVSDCGRDRGAS